MIFEKLVLKINSKFLEARDTSAKTCFLATAEIKEMASDGLWFVSFKTVVAPRREDVFKKLGEKGEIQKTRGIMIALF